jgi:hypothetical protein
MDATAQRFAIGTGTGKQIRENRDGEGTYLAASKDGLGVFVAPVAPKQLTCVFHGVGTGMADHISQSGL